ncbi:MAG: C_GCAxxG_C_C family protein [Lachnospiraceae bacterium]|nr:C_GCAxxG_C_C family protein [Lachnospiraceae bacterium]
MENRVDKAERLFREGYNCAQAVVGAFCDIYGVEEELGVRMAASFGAGFGRMREICGAVSGMGIIAGLENGATKGSDTLGKKANYDLVVLMVEEFKKNNGTIICRELLGLDNKSTKDVKEGSTILDKEQTINKTVDTMPQKRDENYYKTRPCVDKVRECAQIIEDIIMKGKDI